MGLIGRSCDDFDRPINNSDSTAITKDELFNILKNVENKDIVRLLRSVGVSDRQEIFRYFCTECGSDDPVCYCTRDD